MSDNVTITNAWAAVNQSTSLATIVPPSVKSVNGIMGGTGTAGTPANIFMAIAGDTNGLGQRNGHLGTSLGTTVDGFKINMYNFVNVPIVDPSAPALYWKSTANDSRRRLSITGYTI
jgi:hypothetical protein